MRCFNNARARQHALEQDDNEADNGVPDRHLDVVTGDDNALLLKLEQSHENAAPDEIFAGIDVREQAERRMHVGHGRVIEGRLVLFFQERSERVGHRIGEEEHRQQRQQRIAGQGNPAGAARQAVHALFADQFGDGVEGGHQHHQRRNDTGDEAGEHFAAFLEDTDEVFADGGQPAELLFLLDVLQLFLELVDGDRPAVRLRKDNEMVGSMLDSELAMQSSIRDHGTCDMQIVHGHVSMLRQQRKYRHFSSLCHPPVIPVGARRPQSMMPKSVKRFSDDIMLYPFDLEADSDFRSIRPEIIRL